MTDHDPRDVRELLASTAPAEPEVTPADRTAAVTRRARAVTRRHRLVAAGAAVAVVAAIGAGALATRDGEGSAPVAGDDPEVVDAAPVECPAEPVDVGTGLAADALPDGATSARLCPATANGADGPALPEQPVVEDVDALTRAVRDLPAYELEPRCAAIMLPPSPWTLVVGYPDGSTVTLGTSMRTCSAVTVEGVDRSAERVLALFPEATGP